MDEMDEEEILDALAQLLSIVYRRVDWRRMGARNPHDVFQHRVKAAAGQPSLSRAVDYLCERLGVQSLKLSNAERETFRELNRDHSPECLDALAHESILLVAEATARARKYKEQRRKEGKGK